MRCPRCKAEAPAGARYCPQCGASLEGAVLVATPPPAVTPPSAAPGAVEYMGFWVRLLAAIVDALVVGVIQAALTPLLLGPLGFLIALDRGGAPFLPPRMGVVEWAILAGLGPVRLLVGWVYHTLFVGLMGATPGKMLLGMQVVDGQGNVPGLGRAALRETIGKFVSSVVFFLGYLWIAWDERKQGWHDKLADTYVVRRPPGAPLGPRR